MRRAISRILLAVALAVFGLYSVLGLISGTAMAANHCVTPGGTGGCKSTIQAAINAANAGDTVQVAAGVYTENLDISKNVVLLGGYDDATFSTRTPRSSTIFGNHSARVVFIHEGADATVDGFTIMGGDATSDNGQGGGIFVDVASAQILDNLIKDNVGSSDPTVAGFGGGIHVSSATAPVLIQGNTIQENIAYSVSLTSPTEVNFGVGGGLWIADVASAIITGNVVLSNTAARTSIPSSDVFAYGGGMGINGGEVLVAGNEVRGNLGVETGRHAFGGGIDVYDVEAITLTNNVVVHNTAIVSGVQGAGGGGIDIGLPSGDGQSIVLRGNKIMQNTAAYTMTGREFGVMGGGLHVGVSGEDTDVDGNMLTMENNQIIGNVGVWALDAFGDNLQVGARGGGAHVEGVETVVASGNEVRGNVLAESFSMTGDDSGNQGGNADGGGMLVERSMSVTIHNNVFADNIVVRDQNIVGVRSEGSGGGLVLHEVEEAMLTDNRIVQNTAVLRGSFQSDTGEGCNISGGGLGIHGGEDMMGHFTAKNNRIANNTALGRATVEGDFAQCHSEGGGMMMRGISVTVMTGNQFEGNVAARNLTMDGDGSNKWGGRAAGGGLYAGDSYSVTLLNNQFVDNVTTARLTVRDVASGSEAGGFALINVDNGVAKGNTVLRNTALISGSITSDVGEHVGVLGGGVMIACWDKPECLLVFKENEIVNNKAAGETLRQGSNVEANAAGGGIAVAQSKMIVSGNTISGNVGIAIGPDGEGGAIDIRESDVAMEGNRILGNRSRTPSGGESAVTAYRSVVLSTNDIFARNTGGFSGGGDGGVPTTATLINDTFYDNQDVGIRAWEQAVVTVTNTIVYSHNTGLRVDQEPATIKGDYNLLDNGINYENGVTPGSHDITGEIVRFVDAVNDDFHLTKDSPAIDAGDNGAAPSDDFDGNVRPLDGNGDGQAVADIGAYEYGFAPVYLPSIFK